MKSIVFAVLLAGFIGFFVRTLAVMARAAGRGRSDPRPRLDQVGRRALSVLIYFFGQKKVAEEGPLHMTSKHHLVIFWGFLIITIASVEILVSGLIPSVSLGMLPTFLFVPLVWLIDVFNLLVLIAIGWAIFRRIVIKPPLIPMNLDAGLILGAIASLMVTHFLFHGFHTAPFADAAPISGALGGLAAAMPPGQAAFVSEAAYWLHVLILLSFLNYLPYSKHIHLLGALPNILTRNLSERRLDMPKLDLEDEDQWGVGRIEQFSWKSLLDTYACTECARCTNYCPAYATDKNLSPMQLIHDLRYEMVDRDALMTEKEALAANIAMFEADGHNGHNGHKPPDWAHAEARVAAIDAELEAMPALVGGRIAEDTLWACTTCGACQEVCPVFIEHPLKIIQMRQNLILEQEKVPGELARTFRNIERQQNPWGISDEKRMEWADGLTVPTVADEPDPDYILWVGCAGAFDNRIQKQTRAMIKILTAAGVSYAVLGSESCTGDPARRAGNEFLFQELAAANVEALNEAKARKVITSCPHCLHTLRHDYPQFGGDYEVVHHTQLIAKLLDDGALTLEGRSELQKITYHDSCYLGRWNREFEAPRAILDRLPIAGEVTELTRNRQHGFCCGAGGARMFMEEDEPRVNENRTDEVIAAGVDAVAVACPFCNIMLTDGMKARDKEDDIQVLDVAELVAAQIPDVPASALVRKRDRDADAPS